MCDPEIAELLNNNPESWLEALPSWQLADIEELRGPGGKTFDDILDQFLRVSTASGTVPFGGDSGFGLYKQKIQEEFYYFLCSPSKYQEERENWKREAHVSKSSAVAVISYEFAELFDAAPAYLSGVVAVTLVTIGIMNLNAFCAMLAARIADGTPPGPADADQ